MTELPQLEQVSLHETSESERCEEEQQVDLCVVATVATHDFFVVVH